LARNIPWTRDELIITLDFYMKHRASGIPNKGSSEIKMLSSELNRLALLHELPIGEKFRNENGVYLKLMNFHAIDPDWPGTGMANVSQGDRAVFADFAYQSDILDAAAKSIFQHIYHAETNAENQQVLAAEETQAGLIVPSIEGRILSSTHLRRERDPRLVERLKDEYFDANGFIDCTVCAFDFERRYGTHGHKYMEAHHLKPISQLSPEGEETTADDLALICANCHRMVHRKSPWLTIEQLRRMLSE